MTNYTEENFQQDLAAVKAGKSNPTEMAEKWGARGGAFIGLKTTQPPSPIREAKLQPTKTYATEEKARQAIIRFSGGLSTTDRFMIVGVPGTRRFTPLVIHSDQPFAYAKSGFTVVG